jgi:hypothetical protein
MPNLLESPNADQSAAVWQELPTSQPRETAEIAIHAAPHASIQLGGAMLKISVRGTSPRWLSPALQTLQRLASLPENWDSYGAPALDPRSVPAAVSLLSELMSPGTPAPAIVPTSRGWVQFEWHRPGKDLEVEMLSPTTAMLYYFDEQSGTEREEIMHGRFHAAAALLSHIFDH